MINLYITYVYQWVAIELEIYYKERGDEGTNH